MRKALLVLVLIVFGGVASFFVMGQFSRKGAAPGLIEGKLAALPSSPNAVSSDAEGSVAPLTFTDEPADAWARVKAAALALSGATLVTETEDYLAFECRSKIFGFVDDLELHLRPGEQLIAVRSASRVGHSDRGVNGQRVEALRAKFTSISP